MRKDTENKSKILDKDQRYGRRERDFTYKKMSLYFTGRAHCSVILSGWLLIVSRVNPPHRLSASVFV